MVDNSLPVLTGDNSHTLFHTGVNEHYHSTFGAIQESKHVFIEAGLEQLPIYNDPVRILEIGFGTGLNALLSVKWSLTHNHRIEYTSIEPFPINAEVVRKLNYPELVGLEQELFMALHRSGTKWCEVSTNFRFKLHKEKLQDCSLPVAHYDLVFFDAFSPEAQPEMWTSEVFRQIAQSMKAGGLLTTYSSKGMVKRALIASGFSIEKVPGPPGKWEILRATRKPANES
jgi:tRNA U34 5-methylaminomethyl-2-thiouridine-forming methyltransferase MnmC